MKPLIVILFLSLAIYTNESCKENGGIIQMHYVETECANPWNKDSNINLGYGNNDPVYLNKVKSYLEESGIEVIEISITDDGPISGCFACDCSSGRRINISIYEIDKNLAGGLGFKMK